MMMVVAMMAVALHLSLMYGWAAVRVNRLVHRLRVEAAGFKRRRAARGGSR